MFSKIDIMKNWLTIHQSKIKYTITVEPVELVACCEFQNDKSGAVLLSKIDLKFSTK